MRTDFTLSPPVPKLISPADGKEDVSASSGATFQWNKSSGATGYRIVISQNSSFSGFDENNLKCDGTCSTGTTSGTKYVKSSFALSGHTYYWHVRAIGAGGVTSGWSETWELTTAGAASNSFIFPFSQGQSWVICQGYNTEEITHKGYWMIHSFDLSIAPNAAIGTFGCNPATKNASKGEKVFSPASSTISKLIASDLFCLSLDDIASNGAKSIIIGHLTLERGLRITSHLDQGALIGTLDAASSKNGPYSHIHISSYSSKDCSGQSIPFGNVFGGNQNFTSNGTVHQWYGTKVSQ